MLNKGLWTLLNRLFCSFLNFELISFVYKLSSTWSEPFLPDRLLNATSFTTEIERQKTQQHAFDISDWASLQCIRPLRLLAWSTDVSRRTLGVWACPRLGGLAGLLIKSNLASIRPGSCLMLLKVYFSGFIHLFLNSHLITNDKSLTWKSNRDN